ncbi:MAG: hypothetical protein JO093_12720 [Acidobacteria bacterium]|nr:hypothetical protein [Acidobacteriota bacterium]MBV9067224.1 hypothetical protein [Acidobacteriota bacterium]MBV9186479.1 hypothetical protein [Acidobacteriota bacterium]
MGNSIGTPNTVEEFQKKYEKRCISNHNQMDHNEDVCHGMSLDWMQSMLNEQGKTFITVGQSKHGSLTRKLLIKQNRITHNAYIDALDKFNQSFEPFKEKYIKNVMQMEDIGPKIDRFRRIEALDLAGNVSNTTKYRRALKHYGPEMLQLESKQLGFDQKLRWFQTRFDENARNFHHNYNYFVQCYQERKGLFENIEVRPRNSTIHEDAEEVLGMIGTCIDQLESGECAVVNFQREGGGHYVAFYRGGGVYHMFDPNVGWYSEISKTNLWTMFSDLFAVDYLKKPYKTLQWSIFKKN